MNYPHNMYTWLVYTHLLLLMAWYQGGQEGDRPASGTIGVVSIDGRSNVNPMDGFCMENISHDHF